MWLRDLIFKEWWLKVFSLGLAVLIWVTVSFAIRKEGRQELSTLLDTPARVFYVPVLVMSSAADVREFHVKPEHIEVTVRGEPDALGKLRARDVHAIVDLTNIESARGMRMRIQVTTPPGVVYTHVIPEDVEIIIPPKSPAAAPAIAP